MTEPLAGRPALESESSLEGEDYYMDGPYFVFTATYHLKRGYCCNSNCRHCPYKADEENEPAV